MIQHEPTVLPAVHYVRPLGQRTFHHALHRRTMQSHEGSDEVLTAHSGDWRDAGTLFSNRPLNFVSKLLTNARSGSKFKLIPRI